MNLSINIQCLINFPQKQERTREESEPLSQSGSWAEHKPDSGCPSLNWGSDNRGVHRRSPLGIEPLQFVIYFCRHLEQIGLPWDGGYVWACWPSGAMAGQGPCLWSARDWSTQSVHIVRNQKSELKDLENK